MSVVQLKDVSIFQSKNLVLSGVNLQINKGEFVYLIGRTGSGKSSLLKALYGNVEKMTGEATIAGFAIHNLKEKQVPYLRRKLGIVFQDFQLLTDRSVNDNLFFVLKATGWKNKVQMDARVQEVLAQVGLTTKGYKMPFGLSGGEQQRVVIARALLNNPELILADEPTGNLDPETSEEIMHLLYEISGKGCAVLMVTHNYSIIEKFPARIIKCENNKLIETTVSSETPASL